MTTDTVLSSDMRSSKVRSGAVLSGEADLR